MNIDKIKRVYLLGIGGIGMSGLARYFSRLGCQVAGYDRTSTELTKTLQDEGVTIVYSDDLSSVPEYYHLYFMYAVAKYVSKFKGRGSAWTPDLEAEYRELKDNMEGASEVNLSIAGDQQSLLNGAWRVRAGI